MPKILVINPFPLDEEGVKRRAAQTGHVELDPDTELVFRPVKIGPTSFMSPHDWLIMDLGIYEAGLTAEEEGFDANEGRGACRGGFGRTEEACPSETGVSRVLVYFFNSECDQIALKI